jgi:GntR family transcriptional regulator
MEIRLSGGKQSLYLNIVAEYKKLIEAGALRAGEKLPSCRALASELGINPNTVERAYSTLEADGYIRILPQKGAFVCFGETREADLELLQRSVERGKEEGISYADFLKILNEVYGQEEKEKSADEKNNGEEG